MSGSQIIQNVVPSAVDVGNTPLIPSVYSFALTLTQGVSIAIDLKTLVNIHRVGMIQGIFVDNSVGSAGLTITTLAGSALAVPAGSQGMLPLFLSADKVVTFSGSGTINVVLSNFAIGPAIWSATASGSTVVVSGVVSASDSATHSYLSAIEAELAGTLTVSGGVSDSATHTYLSAIQTELAGTLTVSGGVTISGTPNVSDSATHTLLSAISANTANLENAVVSGGGSTTPTYGMTIGGVYQPSPSSSTSGTFKPLETNAFGAIQVDDTGVMPTYTGIATISAPANATDIAILNGSASKIIQILKVEVWPIITGAPLYIEMVKRSTANSGGTSSAVASVPHDSSDGSASAVLLAYSANPTIGTFVGYMGIATLNASSSGQIFPVVFDYSNDNEKPVILRGTAQGLATSFGGGNAAGSVYVRYTWREY